MRCSRTLGVVDRVLSAQFRRLGAHIGRRPSYFIIFPVMITLLAATGVQQLRYQDDPEYLFSPSTGRSKQERATVDRLYPTNFSQFNTGRMVDMGHFIRLVVTAPAGGGPLLTERVFDQLYELDEAVRKVRVDAGEESWTYDQICATWGDDCLDNVALKMRKYIKDVEANKSTVTYPVWFEADDVLPVIETFGSPELDGDRVVDVPALQMLYWVGNHEYFNVSLSLKWELAVQERLAQIIPTFEHLNISRFGSETLKRELDVNTRSVIPYMAATVVVMLLFSMVSTSMADWVRSKPLLGLAGVVSALMACGTAFGILMYCQLEFIGINLAAPFLMLGIGLDDTFVMLAAWRRTRVQDPVPERMAVTYGDAAVSITITSLTNVISFLVGAISPFPSVQIFCLYTGLSVAVTFAWHVLFFGACLALSGYAEQRNLHALTLRPVLPVSQSDSKSPAYRLFCAGGISEKEPWNERDNQDHALMTFFRDSLGRALNKPAVKALVIVAFLCYLGVAIWGCTMVREGLDRRKLSRDDSYAIHAYEVEDRYFRMHPYRIQVVVEGEYNYSDPVLQDQMSTLVDTFKNSTFVDGETDLLTEFWMKRWLFDMDLYDTIGLDGTQSVDNLKSWLEGSQYEQDVIFDSAGEKIVSTRFLIQTQDIRDTQEDMRMMLELRRICDESDFKCTVYHPMFTFFDQFAVVREVSIQSISISAVVMMIVSLIFIPSPTCSLWVAFSIISIETGVVGYMTLWNVNLDCISMINLIMCIGFSVDFSAHISYAYLSGRGLSADDRLREALHSLGLPILQGGVSTILAVGTLALAPSYIFITFFKTNFLVIAFGMLHGMLLLPVLLSLLGPGSHCCSGRGKGEDPEEPRVESIACPEQKIILASETPLRIPRPQTTLPKTKAGSDRDSLESSRDLGLGTSAEEESSSSRESSVGVASDEGPSPATSRSRPARSRSLCARAERYANAGYVTDDELNSPIPAARQRVRHRSERGRPSSRSSSGIASSQSSTQSSSVNSSQPGSPAR
ncbi:patched domain-containing protein 3-like [Amphibalanus amphitrite]|uniref:patched domain-containing protein 3-like n=1 Tax=Amphibalanus amphitrite TaxID=1232801 RepID=UPI001C9214AA|nr:patched domain-containing protein 3-like [Amphibalanus amphitrite]